MGGGGQLTEPAEQVNGRAGGVYTWQEVQSHCSRSDQWLVIDRKVYNITQWAKRHPGGIRVISHYAGENATVTFYRDCKTHLANFKKNFFIYPPNFCFFQEAFTAFHPDLKCVQKFLKPLLIGELAATEPSQDRNKSVRSVSDSSSKNKHLISCVSRQRWDHVQRLRTTQTAYMPCFSCLFASPALKLYSCTSSNVARTSPFSLGPPLTGVCSSSLSGDHHTGFPHFTRQGGERGSVPSSALVLLLPPGSHPAAGGPGLADHLGLGNQLDAHPSQRLPAGNLSGDPEHSFAARRYCQQTLS